MSIFETDACYEIMKYVERDLYIHIGRINKHINNLYKNKYGTETKMEKVYKNNKVEQVIPLVNVNNQEDTSKWCAFSIRKQRIDFLIPMKNKGFAWSNESTLAAAELGDLNLLKWLINDGCSWDQRVLLRAAVLGFEDIVDWSIYHNNTASDYQNEFIL